jgi:ABC-type polysaccharide/polyol phosphate transport system ATPase subunit
MEPGAPAIVVEGVTKRFRRPQEQMHTLKERAMHPFRRRAFDSFTAVDDVSFDVRAGEFFGIVGRNGSGKSTLLKLIAGIYQTNRGEIWVNGRMSTFIELGVGFNPGLAAYDNVLLNGIMLGLTPAEARERYERVIDFAELREFEHLNLKNYSSGMHVRLAFSVMIQVDADVLLVDEVLAVGDASFQQKCFDEFNRLRDEGRTIVLVTHDMGAVRRFCHRAMLIERGKVVAVGDPEGIGSHYLELNFRRIPESAQESDVIDHGIEPYRFGDGRARFVDLWLEDDAGERLHTVGQNRDLVIRAECEFYGDVEDPVVGLSIENEDHWPVFAASSTWTAERTGNFKAGDRATLTVRLPNVLTPGRYHVSPQIAYRGSGLDLLDRRPRMHDFVVTGTRASGAILELDHDLSFKRSSAPSERLVS